MFGMELAGISSCNGGIDGDWGRGSESDGTSTELGTSRSTGLAATWASAGGADASCADSRGSQPTPSRAARPNPLARARLSDRRREELMDKSEYEKPFDNRCAALVSREPRAPRAGHHRKPLMGNALRLMSLLSMARGAQVSRAARRHFVQFIPPLRRPACSELVEPVHRALLPFPGAAGATPSRMWDVTPCPTNVPKCHTCDITWFVHKLITWNGLNLELVECHSFSQNV